MKREGANLAWTVTVPSPCAPRAKSLAFLRSMETNPGKDDSDVKRAVERVKGYLDEADPWGLDAMTIISPAAQSTSGWFSG